MNLPKSAVFPVQNEIKPESAKVVGTSPIFLLSLQQAKRAARSQATVLINGETGTGKEIFARLIHRTSQNARGPFVAINCSAIPEALLESELFGHAKGSFTGASQLRVGLFEEANNGTLFLDEIGDLALHLQAKLLRVLETRSFKRVGENRMHSFNARIIAATHKDLYAEVQKGNFREDLYYRLNVIQLTLPALRERSEDIVLLAEGFLKKFSNSDHSKLKTLSSEAALTLSNHRWPGNIRELENAIERAVALSDQDSLSSTDFSLGSQSTAPISHLAVGHLTNAFTVEFEDNLPSLDSVMRAYILFAISFNHGAKDQTARDINIDRKTLYRRIRQFGTPQFRDTPIEQLSASPS